MIKSIGLYAFRNYMRQEVLLKPHVNVFLGANAQGKTNLLEAIYVAATGRSPRSAVMAEMIMWEQAGCRLVLGFDEPVGEAGASTDGKEHSLEIRLEREPTSNRVRRTLTLDNRALSLQKLAGRIKVVLFHPEEMTLIRGSGEPRRRLLNNLMVQAQPGFVELLTRYGRVIEQRNQLLKRIAQDLDDRATLSWWAGEAARLGGEMMRARSTCILELAPRVAEHYRRISGGEDIELRYAPSVAAEGDPEEAIRTELEKRVVEELARGLTVAGPHRDDLHFTLGGQRASAHASQGQQRTAILALKLAEVDLLSGDGNPPVLLLDDVMSELDGPRRVGLLDVVEGSPQALITTAEEGYFPPGFIERVSTRRVVAGSVH